MGITITIDKKNAVSIVHVAGKIDATTSEDLEDSLMDLLDKGETKIILELENTDYISSAGLRVLVVITKHLYDSGFFCLCNVSENVSEIIEMAGFNTFMNVYEDLETALDQIKKE